MEGQSLSISGHSPPRIEPSLPAKIDSYLARTTGRRRCMRSRSLGSGFANDQRRWRGKTNGEFTFTLAYCKLPRPDDGLEASQASESQTTTSEPGGRTESIRRARFQPARVCRLATDALSSTSSAWEPLRPCRSGRRPSAGYSKKTVLRRLDRLV